MVAIRKLTAYDHWVCMSDQGTEQQPNANEMTKGGP